MLHHMCGFMPLTSRTQTNGYVEFTSDAVMHVAQDKCGAQSDNRSLSETTAYSEKSDSMTGKLPGVLAHWK